MTGLTWFNRSAQGNSCLPGLKIQLPAMLAIACLIMGQPARAVELWYEDNNLGKANGMPADFVEKFDRQEEFKDATKVIRVYMVRSMVLAKMSDDFLANKLLPYLRKNDIKLAVDAVGATWGQHEARQRVASGEIDLLKRLRRLGIDVTYISLQSVLSKPLMVGGGRAEYSMAQRVADVVAYAKLARTVFPSAAIGIIDALPSHGKPYREPYRQLKDALAKASIGLSYLHLDIPFELVFTGQHGLTWQAVREVERFVEEGLGVRFGLIATSSQGGVESSRAFHEGVMAALECYWRANGTPDDFVIASWFTFPQRTIPEYSSGDEFPAMRTVLEFGRRMGQLEKSPPKDIDSLLSGRQCVADAGRKMRKKARMPVR